MRERVEGGRYCLPMLQRNEGDRSWNENRDLATRTGLSLWRELGYNFQ